VPSVDGFKYLLITSQECNYMMRLLTRQRPLRSNDNSPHRDRHLFLTADIPNGNHDGRISLEKAATGVLLHSSPCSRCERSSSSDGGRRFNFFSELQNAVCHSGCVERASGRLFGPSGLVLYPVAAFIVAGL
jgi:hypothetical protein